MRIIVLKSDTSNKYITVMVDPGNAISALEWLSIHMPGQYYIGTTITEIIFLDPENALLFKLSFS